MSMLEVTHASTIRWLLDNPEPAVRLLTLRDLLDRPADDPELRETRAAAHQSGAIALILNAMQPEGYWEKATPGYGPKYKSAVWALLLLAQLGADVDSDPRVRTACDYHLDHGLSVGGHFSYNGAPGGTFDCLQGNMLWALARLGCTDPRLDEAAAWMARSNLGEGMAPKTEKHAVDRYYAYKSGPGFQCGANANQPCSWGAAKVMLAYSALPVDRRTPLIERAIAQGVEYFFCVPPETAAWPVNAKDWPNAGWWKLAFPVFYITDLLQVAEALTDLGYARDPRLAGLINWVRSKQNAAGQWPLEYNYGSKTWGRYGALNKPNPYVTIRALRVLKDAGEENLA